MELLDVGRISKAHGLRGEVIVDLTTNRTERLQPGAVLHTAGGTLTVLRSSRHGTRWIVAFDGVEDRNAADGLRGTVLRAEPLHDEDALWVHELIGSVVTDATGTERGTVVTVVANPASDLLELDTGALVPLRFLTERSPGRVVVEAPEGLFET